MTVRYTAGKLIKMEGKLFDYGDELPADIVESFVNLPALISAGEIMVEEIEEAVVEQPKPQPKAKKKRAKNSDGTFKSDDPSTPDINEAWVEESEPKVGEDDLDI